MGGHFMFNDDQETPNVLHATYYFDAPNAPGGHKMMELEVRHWITNHEAEIGSGAYKSSAPPAAGLAAGGGQAARPNAPSRTSNRNQTGVVDARTNTIGNTFYGSNGYLGIDNYDAYKTWIGDNAEPGPSGKASGDHYKNFVDCIRSRKAEDIHSPIEEAHISCTLLHLANTSYRLGRVLKYDGAKQQVIGDDEANKMLRGAYRAPYVVPEKV
jgi:hypothetical protein